MRYLICFCLLALSALEASHPPYLYVSTPTPGDIAVIDTVTLSTIATISTGLTIDEIAITPNGKLGYIATGSGSGNVVGVFDALHFTTLPSIPSGAVNPTHLSITYDSASVYVLCDNGDSGTHTGTISVISTSSQSVVNTLSPSNTYSGGITVAPNGSFVYVADTNTNSVDWFNNANVHNTVTTAAGSNPLLFAFSPNGPYAYTLKSNNNVGVITTQPSPGTETTSLTLTGGTNVDAVGIALAHVPHQDRSTLLITGTASGGPPQQCYLFSVDANGGTIMQNTLSGPCSPVYCFPLTSSPFVLQVQDIVISPDGKTAYIGASNSTLHHSLILIYDIASNSMTGSLQVGSGDDPPHLAIGPSIFVPDIAASLTIAQSAAVADLQAQTNYYEAIRVIEDQLQTIGLIDTYADNLPAAVQQIRIIDAETIFTNEVTLPPIWCN